MEYNKNEEISYEYLPNDHSDYDLSIKTILLGSSKVGKSALSNKVMGNQFDGLIFPTVGFEFYDCYIKIKEKVLKLQIWDTAGLEIYQSLISSFYKHSSIVLIIFSIDE